MQLGNSKYTLQQIMSSRTQWEHLIIITGAFTLSMYVMYFLWDPLYSGRFISVTRMEITRWFIQ
ncbi:hypothetical protein [Pedobacter faecalis]|uniref:hypothetical protein n=1 Tax=Pedobacter faecalis TaxID=3041495 RepID=UPI00254E6183|nr:hypothetical protein [Pedobacter sp. ELA7]